MPESSLIETYYEMHGTAPDGSARLLADMFQREIDTKNTEERRMKELSDANDRLEAYGEDELSRRQKIMLGLRPEVIFDPSLDPTQQDISLWFQKAQTTADELALDRFDQDLNSRIVDKSRTAFASIASHTVSDLERIFQEVETSIPIMSVHKDSSIDRNDGPMYLQQEVLREKFRQQLVIWNKTYAAMRESLRRRERAAYRSITPEEELCNESIDVLCGTLSSLSDPNEISRAGYILSEIEKQRSELWSSFFRAPLQFARTSAISITAAVAALEHIFAAGFGIVTTAGAQYAYTGLKNAWQIAELNAPERNALALLREHCENDRAGVVMALAEAGIMDSPEEVLGIPTE
jgi:hypothetical protein